MDRKTFIKYTGIAAPVALALFEIRKSYLHKIIQQAAYKDRVLVLIQLNGGNDSLNTVIPLQSYDILSRVRKNLLIPENKVLKLNDTNHFGFHPALTGLQKLYDDKMMSIVHGVSYPNPEHSHFKGINIKITANVKADSSKSGWIGRYLEQEFPAYANPAPLQYNSGPACMRLGDAPLLIAQGDTHDYSIGVSDVHDMSFDGLDIPVDPADNNMGGKTVAFIRDLSREAELFAPAIKSASERQKNLSKLYPEDNKNPLADQLKAVARLIGGGLKSRVFVVRQNGYDTHADQVDKSDTTAGLHAKLLAGLSEAITAFEDDLHLMGRQEDVLGMTFSEFGRRIKSEDSYGCDHGSGESVILFGAKLRHRMLGSEPEKAIKITDEDIPMQCDFRSLYASVLNGWFGLPENHLKVVIPQLPDDRLDLFLS